MLKTRVLTALALLALLLLVLLSNSFLVFALALSLFFAAASWESFRLFNSKYPIIGAIIWTGIFVYLLFETDISKTKFLFAVSVAIWGIRFAPSLAIGLPSLNSVGNRLLNGVYGFAILCCFISMATLLKQSPLYLFSVMSIVWIADIGAYFSGKAFGKHKLAPSISPGKSWEGAIGGWIAVLTVSAASTFVPVLNNTFAVKVFSQWGWPALLAVLSLLVAASIVGDLFESQLKRRAGMKDSSNLLPGHGGVLDRIDALIPALPLAALLTFWL